MSRFTELMKAVPKKADGKIDHHSQEWQRVKSYLQQRGAPAAFERKRQEALALISEIENDVHDMLR